MSRRASRYRRPSRGRATLAAFGVVAVSLVVGVVVWRTDDSDTESEPEPSAGRTDESIDREGSAAIDDADPIEIELEDEPRGYRITYRNVVRGAADVVEAVTVRRPFTSETVTEDANGAVTTVSRSAFGRLVTDAHKEQPLVFAVGPAATTADLRLAPALAEALERGWLERREVREVAGRPCQVYRAGTTVVGGALAPPGDPAEEYADACFDASGLLLEEWWVVEGEPIRQRIAVDVEDRAPADLGDDWVYDDPSMTVELGGGSIQRLRPGSSPPGAFFTVGEVPAGFEHVGRYSVLPPQADAFDDSGDRGSVVASAADVWLRGSDLLVVDQGGTLGGVARYEPDPDNRTVVLPDLGAVELVVNLTANEVRIHRDVGRFVRVIGTLPHDVLLDVARSLVLGEGNELVVEDGPLLPERFDG